MIVDPEKAVDLLAQVLDMQPVPVLPMDSRYADVVWLPCTCHRAPELREQAIAQALRPGLLATAKTHGTPCAWRDQVEQLVEMWDEKDRELGR